MMPVLLQMVDHYKKLRDQTAEEIALIEAGKLVIPRYGKNGTEFWKAELQDRLVRIDKILETYDNRGA
jgi:hypothetical protein